MSMESIIAMALKGVAWGEDEFADDISTMSSYPECQTITSLWEDQERREGMVAEMFWQQIFELQNATRSLRWNLGDLYLSCLGEEEVKVIDYKWIA